MVPWEKSKSSWSLAYTVCLLLTSAVQKLILETMGENVVCRLKVRMPWQFENGQPTATQIGPVQHTYLFLSNATFNPVAQSMCTHYSCFENMGWFLTLKKRSKKWVAKKQGAKKVGYFYSKREKAAWPLLFLNNNDPGFLHPIFATHILDYFKVPDPKKISGRPDTLE